VAKTTRREFHRRAAGAIACGLTAAIAGPTLAAEKKYPPGRYVDMHTHLGTVWNTTTQLTATDLLRWMDSSDIAQAVVLPLSSPESSSYLITTDDTLRQTAPHRDRLIPFCSIDPRTSYSGGVKGLVGILKKYVDAGARGFGEHKPGVAIDDPGNMRIYEACQELGLPLLFHLDNLRNMDAPGLPGLEKALKTFPKLNFIGHGPGFWASIAGGLEQKGLGGYARGEVPPGGALDRLMEAYPNLYGDLSAGSGSNAISRDPKFGPEFVKRRADRLVFGTDYLSPGQNVPQLELYAKLDLPADVQAKVFRDNARKLLGI
jgi:predicted TIM-barrel fold metal-dependent hydrolase